MTVKELRDALFLVNDQEMSIEDLRWMLFNAPDQEQELDAWHMREIMVHAAEVIAAGAAPEAVTLVEDRFWSPDKVMSVCKRRDLYTCGSNADYEKMLNMVGSTSPDIECIYRVAKDIAEHSDDVPIETIMYYLANEAAWSTFEIHKNHS